MGAKLGAHLRCFEGLQGSHRWTAAADVVGDPNRAAGSCVFDVPVAPCQAAAATAIPGASCTHPAAVVDLQPPLGQRVAMVPVQGCASPDARECQ